MGQLDCKRTLNIRVHWTILPIHSEIGWTVGHIGHCVIHILLSILYPSVPFRIDRIVQWTSMCVHCPSYLTVDRRDCPMDSHTMYIIFLLSQLHVAIGEEGLSNYYITSMHTNQLTCGVKKKHSKPGADLGRVIVYYKLTHPLVTTCYFAC